jgi:hypothetical protein
MKAVKYRDGVRYRRSADELQQLDSQIIAVLNEDHPQSIRHVFYRMTDPRLPVPIEKTENGYERIGSRITKLRRSGQLEYDWISDSTRRGYHVNTYSDKGDFLRQVAGLYRADLWEQSEWYCEVWTESRSIAGVIEEMCEELAVSLYPCGGFSSITLAYQAAEQINSILYRNMKPVQIFYIGDYDQAGVLIDTALERELREHLDDFVDLNFERIAINEKQIQHYDLPTKPRKKSDIRSRQVKKTVEAEAMPARILREMLRGEIEALLPPGALAVARAAEKSEQEGIRLLAGRA